MIQPSAGCVEIRGRPRVLASYGAGGSKRGTSTSRDEWFSFFGRAGFDLNESTQIYTQVMWADYQADRQLAATPVTGVHVQPDNPNLSPEVAALLATRPDRTRRSPPGSA